MPNNTTNWSPEQQKIFDWFRNGQGNLVVRARAGTGKTTTILEAVQAHAPEAKILLAAFNKTIAQELQSRITDGRIQAKTLHGLGYAFIRKAWGNINVDANGEREINLAQSACPSDTNPDAIRLVGRVHSKVRELLPTHHPVESIMDLMTSYDLLPDEGLEMSEGYTPRWIAEHALKAVEAAKKQTASIDFADMIFLPLALGIIRPWFNMVVVDEAQDMTAAQLELAMRACKKTGRIAIVGDDRQAIYAFRGADSGSIDRLKAALRATELGLTTTYRCPKQVVAIAREIVSDFNAADSAPEGTIESCNTPRMIATLGPRDFVLSRTNAPLVRVCLTLLRAGRKAVIRGRDIGKGITALVNRQKARDLISLSKKLHAWRERETKRAVETLKPNAAEDRIAYLNDSIGVIEALMEDVKTVSELTSKLATLFTDDNGEAVVCSTTHKAKGLESRNVYLLEGTFRGRRAGEPEERNILYVAVTRSKNRLVWVSGFEK